MPFLFAAVNVFVIAEAMALDQLIERYVSHQAKSNVLYKICKKSCHWLIDRKD
jgi:hypothetical protein